MGFCQGIYDSVPTIPPLQSGEDNESAWAHSLDRFLNLVTFPPKEGAV